MAEDDTTTKKPTKACKGFSARNAPRCRSAHRTANAEASKADGERAVQEASAAMTAPDRGARQRPHGIITASAPDLAPKTWYGMPAYAQDGKIVCFFQPAEKFKTRYATLGFTDGATLDDGAMWPVAYALKELTAATEAEIGALVKKAVADRADDAPGPSRGASALRAAGLRLRPACAPASRFPYELVSNRSSKGLVV